jgi:hypothetical protein
MAFKTAFLAYRGGAKMLQGLVNVAEHNCNATLVSVMKNNDMEKINLSVNFNRDYNRELGKMDTWKYQRRMKCQGGLSARED